MISKDDLKFFGFLAVIFGAIILLTNPINWVAFPANISYSSWFGLILIIAGLVGFWYYNKSTNFYRKNSGTASPTQSSPSKKTSSYLYSNFRDDSFSSQLLTKEKSKLHSGQKEKHFSLRNS